MTKYCRGFGVCLVGLGVCIFSRVRIATFHLKMRGFEKDKENTVEVAGL